MSYASKQEMIDRFGSDELIQLTDRATPPAGVIDDTVLNAALADADDEINGYLQAKYTLPLASVPLLIKKLARTICRYNLYDDLPPEHIESRYTGAIKTLEGIARGLMHLGLDNTGKPTPETSMPETKADPAVFTPDSVSGFIGR